MTDKSYTYLFTTTEIMESVKAARDTKLQKIIRAQVQRWFEHPEERKSVCEEIVRALQKSDDALPGSYAVSHVDNALEKYLLEEKRAAVAAVTLEVMGAGGIAQPEEAAFKLVRPLVSAYFNEKSAPVKDTLLKGVFAVVNLSRPAQEGRITVAQGARITTILKSRQPTMPV